jgi:hypothetical protein
MANIFDEKSVGQSINDARGRNTTRGEIGDFAFSNRGLLFGRQSEISIFAQQQNPRRLISAFVAGAALKGHIGIVYLTGDTFGERDRALHLAGVIGVSFSSGSPGRCSAHGPLAMLPTWRSIGGGEIPLLGSWR